ncbi:conserved hypothetical protein [Alteracholeplasma palmae J233]|uniref:Uncharacterized protein n=1 Tax=Alteracholeplasma palmae (strain ATCC 49389 / J233) TaxID=1318466 RepID=U4KQZ9_ALTPJ|nr:permease prefix domain 1-containing protein [Alteracholeplasma palmae]CCV63741.1 conserved hypothetical protein [Alteracholeplasma palmae J233]
MNQTLKSFIDNLFIGIDSDEVLKIKEGLYQSTEEKYEDLLSEGLTENEAIGKVIAEFGDLKEILTELNIDNKVLNDKETKVIIKTEFERKYKSIKIAALLIGIATFLILTVVGVVATISELKEFSLKDLTQILVLIIGIIPSIGMYIYAGIKLESEKKQKNVLYVLAENTKEIVKKEVLDHKKKFVMAIISGVSLCLIGVVLFILGSGELENIFAERSIFYLLGFMLIGLAVFLFIYFGTVKEFLDDIENPSKIKGDKKDSMAEKVSGAIFIFATIIYLMSGFIYKAWGTMWIVYPISGLIVGIIHIFLGEEKE